MNVGITASASTTAARQRRHIERLHRGERDVCGITGEALRQRLSRARAVLAERLDASNQPGVVVLREVRP